MIATLEKLMFYLSYPFVQYALIVGILVALCTALLGVTLVLKRFSFIGDGLSHVAFGTMAIAAVANFASDMPVVLGVTVVCAIVLLRMEKATRLNGDAVVAMFSTGALALGYLVMNRFSSSANLAGDVCTTLFGSTSILTLSMQDVWICAVLSVAVVVFYLFFYQKIFAITFDEAFAAATGTPTDLYGLLFSVITAVVIVMAVNLVGSLLISALIVFPAMASMRIFKSFRSVTVCSAILSVVCAIAGIVISILFGTPVGSTIVAVDMAAFAGFSVIGFIQTR